MWQRTSRNTSELGMEPAVRGASIASKKKTYFFFMSSWHLETASGSGRGLLSTSPLGPHLALTCQVLQLLPQSLFLCSFLCFMCIGSVVSSRSSFLVSLHSRCLLQSFCLLSWEKFIDPWAEGFEGDILIKIECSKVSHSVYGVQLWISVLFSCAAGGSPSDNGWSGHWSVSIAECH